VSAATLHCEAPGSCRVRAETDQLAEKPQGDSQGSEETSSGVGAVRPLVDGLPLTGVAAHPVSSGTDEQPEGDVAQQAGGNGGTFTCFHHWVHLLSEVSEGKGARLPSTLRGGTRPPHGVRSRGLARHPASSSIGQLLRSLRESMWCGFSGFTSREGWLVEGSLGYRSQNDLDPRLYIL
jgi:hypothetical protein